jgi:hypothetical protein
MTRWARFVLALRYAGALGAMACGGSTESASTSASEAQAVACQPPDGGASCPATPPSFTNDVLPILNRDCNSTCHGPNAGQWELADYGDVSDWASLIQLDLTDCAMPPGDAGAYPTADRTTVLAWIACGAPNN